MAGSTTPKWGYSEHFPENIFYNMNIEEKEHLFYKIIQLPKRDLRSLFRRLIREGLSPSDLEWLEEEVFKARHFDKHSHAAKWMESRLARYPKSTPYVLASAYISMFSGNKRLFPFYLTLARKVKDRVRKRSKK